MRNRVTHAALAIIVCALAATASAERVRLFSDVSPGVDATAPSNFFVFGTTMLFSADDGTHGRELWFTDGLSYHTQMLSDINAEGSSSPSHFTQLFGKVLFSADDGIAGRELWVSDGTAAHTQMVMNINPGGAGSNPQDLTVFNGKVYFSADDGAHGRELWETDGNEVNTKLVADIRPGVEGSTLSGLTVVGGLLVFSANDGATGQELWASDGTGPGTALVKDINPSSGSSPQGFYVLNTKAYFAADDGSAGSQLWATDGTSGGTYLVKALNGAGDFAGPTILGSLNGKLYLSSRGVRSGVQAGVTLWTSDGFNITPVIGINGGGVCVSPAGFIAYNGTPYFSASANGYNNELWTSDGASTAAPVAEINPDTTGAALSGSEPSNFIVFQNKLYFTARRPADGEELWSTDGSLFGTSNVADVLPGAEGSAPRDLTSFGGSLYFSAKTAGGIRRMFVMDDGTNGLPTASSVVVTPSSPHDPDDLTVSYTFTDPDSDPEGPTGVLWFKDGVRQFSLDGATTISGSLTHPGETWYSVITPVDNRGGQGSSAQSNSVLILPIPGDVDGSGVVNAIDIQLVINAALGLPSDIDADVNHDGKVDAVDVQLVINAALGLK